MSETAKLRHRTISGMFWKFGERASAQLVSFLISIYLARILSPDEYGLIAIVLIFMALADVFVSSGFSASLIQKKDADELDYSTIFYCSLAVSVVIYLLLFVTAPFIARFYKNDYLTILIRVFSLRIPLSSLNAVQHAYVSNRMLFRKFFWSTLFGTLVSGLIGIWMAKNGYGVWALVAQYMLNTLIDSLVLLVTISWRPKMMFSWQRARSLMAFGYKVLLASLSGTFFDQLRGFIIGRKYTAADLAYYNKGQQFSTLITNNISASIMAVLFPSISKVNDDLGKVRNFTRKSIQLLSFVMFPLLMGLASCAEPIVIFLLTDKWAESIPYVQLMAVFSLINVISSVSLETFKALGRSDVTLKLEFIKKPVYIILLIIGVKYGVLAMAVTLVIYSIYGAAVNMYYLMKLTDYTLKEQFSDIIPVAGMTAVMASAVYFFNIIPGSDLLTLVSKVLLGVIIYVVLSLFVKPRGFIYIKSVFNDMILKRGNR